MKWGPNFKQFKFVWKQFAGFLVLGLNPPIVCSKLWFSLTTALEKKVFMEMDPKMERKMEPGGAW